MSDDIRENVFAVLDGCKSDDQVVSALASLGFQRIKRKPDLHLEAAIACQLMYSMQPPYSQEQAENYIRMKYYDGKRAGYQSKIARGRFGNSRTAKRAVFAMSSAEKQRHCNEIIKTLMA